MAEMILKAMLAICDKMESLHYRANCLAHLINCQDLYSIDEKQNCFIDWAKNVTDTVSNESKPAVHNKRAK